jgi:hypothetical protein
MDRRSFLGLLAGSFAAVPVLGLKDLLPLGITPRGIRPVGNLPIDKIRWSKPMPFPDQAVIVGRALVDVTHDCACGWTASGMFATYSVKEADVKNNRHLVELLEVKKQNAILALQDIWNTAKNEPFLNHASCPKIVGAYRLPIDFDES